MEALLVPDERTDLVSKNGPGHGWTYEKLANQQAISELAARMAVIGCQLKSCSLFVETKERRSTQCFKTLINAASILSILLELQQVIGSPLTLLNLWQQLTQIGTIFAPTSQYTHNK